MLAGSGDLVAGLGRRPRDLRGGPWRLPRAPGARRGAHAARRARRPGRAGVRPARARRRAPTCPARAWSGTGRAGCARAASRRRGRARRRRARRSCPQPSPRPASIVHVDAVAGRAPRRRHRGPRAPRPRPCGRVDRDRHDVRAGRPRQARRAAALPLGRGGDLRRARRATARSSSATTSTRCVPGTVVSAAGRHRGRAHVPGRPGRAHVPGVRHPRAERHLLLPALRQGVLWSASGVVGRIEPVDFWEGED